jgi:hypothetical protein
LGGSAHIGAGLQELEHAVDLAVHRREHQRSLDREKQAGEKDEIFVL